MKTRLMRCVSATVAFLLVVTGYGCTGRVPRATPVLAGTVNRDCAPWDGPAFTVSIPVDPAGLVTISIWRAPGLQRPSQFSFPDPTREIGNAAYRTWAGANRALSGTVTLQPAGQADPVEGEMMLTSDSGQVFQGRFSAVWGSTRAFCG